MGFAPGDKVYGLGKHGFAWPSTPLGTVVSRPELANSGSVFVQWDNSFVEDEMDPADLLPAPSTISTRTGKDA